MHLIKCLDNLTCCYIDLPWLNSYDTDYYIIHFLEQFILLHIQIRVEIINEICLDQYIIKSIKIARYIY